MNKLSSKVKGHGYLKKTKLGLVSGIILASSVFVSLSSNTFVLAEETNTNSTENVASNGKSETKDEFVREETVPVKEVELKAKVEEVKKAGVNVEEKQDENVGTAKVESEEAALKKAGETKVDEQIKDLEEAKVEEANRQAEVEKISKLKENFISTPNKRFLLLNHLSSRELENDYGKTKTFTDFKSNMGNVQFLDKDKINLSNPRHFKNISDEALTETPKTVKTKMVELSNNVPKEYKENIKKEQDAYIIKVRDGETVSYNTKLDQDSYLRKEFGIDTISIEKTYNFGLTEKPDYFDVVTDKMAVESYILSKVIKSANPEDRIPSVTTKYIYKDENGNAIPFNKLYAKVINDSIFNKQNLLKESDVPLEAFKNPEAVPIRGDYSLLRKIGYKGTATEDGGLTQTFEHYFNNPQHYYNFSANSIYYFRKKNLLNDIDYEKIMKPVSANYHLITYKKLIDTGVVQQKFVDEKGNEIAPTIISEKSDKGSKVTVATPPNEIIYKGQTYLLQKENIPSSLVIKKGVNSVTFSYKLQVVTDKGTPEHLKPLEFNGVVPNEAPKLEVPEFNGGVVPNEAPKLEIPEYTEPVSMKGEPLVQPELPAFDLNNKQPKQNYELPKSQQEDQTKKSTFEETSKSNESKVQTSTEKIQSKNQEKEVVHQTVSEKLVPNKQVLPNTGMADTNLYYTISASVMSFLGMMSLNFKKKDKK